MGKGSKRRPQEVDDEYVAAEWARLFNTERGKRDIREIARIEKERRSISYKGDEGPTPGVEGGDDLS